MMEIFPAILVHSKEEFLDNIAAIHDVAKQVHIDIADGRFVPNTTWADPDVIQKLLPLDCELHLMVEDPLKEFLRWKDVKQVKRVLAHVETTDLHTVIQMIQKSGKEASVAVNADTSVSRAETYLPYADGILFMGIQPGFQGKQFASKVLEKINRFQRRRTTHFIEVDGGINEETLPQIQKTGVDAVCIGSAVFKTGNPKENFLRLKQLTKKAMT